MMKKDSCISKWGDDASGLKDMLGLISVHSTFQRTAGVRHFTVNSAESYDQVKCRGSGTHHSQNKDLLLVGRCCGK